MKKRTLNRPRMIPISVSGKKIKPIVSDGNLNANADPSTAYIVTIPGQQSILDLTMSVQNTSLDTPIAIQLIAINLPVNTATPATDLTESVFLGGIIPTAAQPELWSIVPGAIPGQFLASPQQGDANILAPGDHYSFALDNIILNKTVGTAEVVTQIKEANDTITALSSPISKQLAKAEILNFIAQPSEISPGDTSFLNWDTIQIDYCLISPGFDDPSSPLEPSGSVNVQPLETTIYTLWAYGPGTLLSTQQGVTVLRPRILTFGKVGEGSVNYGDKADLYWQTNEVTTRVTLTATPAVDIPTELPTHGQVTVGPLTSKTDFVLRAFDDKNNESIPVHLFVDVTYPLPVITTFIARWQGDRLILEWETEHATEVNISPIPFALLPNGTTAVFPDYALEDSYTLTASNAEGVKSTSTLAYTSLEKVAGSPVSVGNSPRSVAVTPDGYRVFVANLNSHNITVLDAKTLLRLDVINVGESPIFVTVSPDGRRIYIAHSRDGSSGRLSILDAQTLSPIAGSPAMVGAWPNSIAISPDNRRAYITNRNDNTVTVIDTQTLSPVTGSPVAVQKWPESVAVSKDGNRIYVANNDSKSLSVIDTNTLTPVSGSPVRVGTWPISVAVSPDDALVYVVNNESRANDMTILDTLTLQPINDSPVPVNSGPMCVTVSPNNSHIFVANQHGNSLTVLNTKTLKQISGSPFKDGLGPFSVVVTPDSVRSFVANSRSNTVTVMQPKYTLLPE